MDSVEMKLRSGRRTIRIPCITLPPELLRMIFIACADPPYAEHGAEDPIVEDEEDEEDSDDDEEDGNRSGKLDSISGPSYWCQSRSMQWIAITHVCRYWRSVALGYSDLWTRLRFFNPDVTTEMIRRSKGANLEVIIDPRLQIHRLIAKSPVIPMVLHELHRVSVLHLVSPQLLESLVEGLVSAAPKLEHLYLSDPRSKSVFPIPDTILSRGTPALRSLELHNCG